MLPTLFAPSVKDQSLVYLYGIFGSMNGVIPIPGGGGGATTDITLLGTMFKTFNSTMLAVGALIVVYVTVVGVMNTAHEGQFMGKNWNNLWIPIRMVLGIASLVPTGTGYSGLQIIMMWVIVQGIGAADTLWSTALTYVSTMGSPYAKSVIPSTEVKAGLSSLFQGIVCMKSAGSAYVNAFGKDEKWGAYYCNNPANDPEFCKAVTNPATFAPTFDDPNQSTYMPFTKGSCGKLVYCNETESCKVIPGQEKTTGPDSLQCKSCKTQRASLKDIIPTFAAIAERYVMIDYIYTDFWEKSHKAVEDAKSNPGSAPTIAPPTFVQNYCSAKGLYPCTAANLPEPTNKDTKMMSAPASVIAEIYWKYGLQPDIGSDNFIGTATNYYVGNIGAAFSDYIDALIHNPSVKLTGPLQDASDNGWIMAGSYYHIVARGNDNNFKAVIPIIKYDWEMALIPIQPDTPLYKMRNNFKAASRLVCLASGSSSCTNEADEAWGPMANGAQDSGAAFTQLVSNKTAEDPLAGLIATGRTFMAIAATIIFVFMALFLILAVVSSIMVMVLGNGLVMNPLFPFTLELLMIVLPLVFAFSAFLISVGATLNVYIPLIPYIVFTMGAIGWMISTVEAMVAGPLVALGIMSPSGHHEVMGKAEPALGLLFAIFLRPSLMIFGMMAAMLISAAVVTMVNTGFDTVTKSAVDLANPITQIVVFLAYISLIVAALNKTFSAIYIIPERVLSWISIQVPHEGAQELGEVKGGVDKGAETASSGGKAATEGSQSSLGSSQKGAKNVGMMEHGKGKGTSADEGPAQPGEGGEGPAMQGHADNFGSPVDPGKGGEGPAAQGEAGNHPGGGGGGGGGGGD